jgi:hypothetical protein
MIVRLSWVDPLVSGNRESLLSYGIVDELWDPGQNPFELPQWLAYSYLIVFHEEFADGTLVRAAAFFDD